MLIKMLIKNIYTIYYTLSVTIYVIIYLVVSEEFIHMLCDVEDRESVIQYNEAASKGI